MAKRDYFFKNKITGGKRKNHDPQFRVIFEKSPLPMLIYELLSFKILDVNEIAISLYGYNRAEFLSMTILDYWIIAEVEAFSKVSKISADNDSAHKFGLYQHIKKDKTFIKVEVSGYPIMHSEKNCMLVFFNDVTEKEVELQNIKNNEQKLKDSQQQLTLVYNNVKDVIFVIAVEEA